ncbi:MAG TPA: S49 family peptidase, partial [Pirellulales bacterium]
MRLSLKSTTWLVLLPALLVGCKLPTLPTVNTYNVVKMAAPVRTEVDMTPERGPIVEVPLYGGCNSSQPHVAIIDIDGPLLNVQPSSLMGGEENPLSFFREKLDAVSRRPNVTGLVLRINSAGGSVTASDVMYRELVNYKARSGKPVIACMMDVGTGGAYYIACGADAVVAHPTTVVGGMGVILNLYNLREAMATFNIIPQSIKSGSKIDMGASTSMLTPEASE